MLRKTGELNKINIVKQDDLDTDDKKENKEENKED